MIIYHILRIIYPSYIHAHLSRDRVSTVPRRRHGRHVRRNYWWLNRDFDSSSSSSSSFSSSSSSMSSSSSFTAGPRARPEGGGRHGIADRQAINLFFSFIPFPAGRAPRGAENGETHWWGKKKNLPLISQRGGVWFDVGGDSEFSENPFFPQNVYKRQAVLLF